jgi:opacity protein-like surface antigen
MISKVLLQLGQNYTIWTANIKPYIEGGYVVADTNINSTPTNTFKPFQSGYAVGGGIDYTVKDGCFGKFAYNYCNAPQQINNKDTYFINDFIFGLGYKF